MKQTEIGVIPEDWEVDYLSNLTNRIGDGIHSTPIYSDNDDFYFINGNNLGNGFINFDTSTKTVSSEQYKLHKRDLNDNTILLSINGTIGNIAYYRNELIILGKSACYINLKNSLNKKFIFYILQSKHVQKYFEDNLTGSTIKNLGLGTISNTQIPLPPLPEQEAIAAALSDADAWIKSLEQLIAKKRLIKQGAMQTLLTPKDDWQVKKLGEVGKCLRGVSYSGDSDLYESENEDSIKLLRSNNVYNSKVVFSNIQNVKKAKVKEHQIIQKSDILICMANGSKELVGKAGFCNHTFDSEKYTFGAFMGIFRITENVNSYFIYLNFLSKNYRNFIELLLSGSSINNLKPSDIEQIEIKIPFLSEQERIATILSDIDAELEALEQQLAKARLIKQGMMQELLTGRVRLV